MAVPFKGIYAAERPTLTVEAVEANPGDEVRLAVSLSNNPGICAFRMSVNYDEGLTLTAVSDAKLYGDHMFGNDLNANPYILMWDESLKTRPNTNNGVLAYLTFKVDKNAAFGTHKVWITYRTGDIYDLDLKDIDVDLVAGGVTLKNASVTATPTPVVTSVPTPVATSTPAPVPTNVSTPVPTRIPTPVVTAMPTPVATGYPTSVPTYGPTRVPTSVPTSVITSTPTSSPTGVPTNVPTTVVTVTPTPVATGYPTLAPTNTPTSTPTMVPTVAPTAIITSTPTLQPTGQDNNVTPTEAGNPDVTVTPAVTKPFTVTITDEYGQTVKYKVTPESGKKGSVAGKATVVSLKTSKKSIIIPDSVKIDGKNYNITAIGKNALKANKKATKLQIGTNVTTIGKAAFKSLKKLKTITINSSKISVIGSSAFKGIATKAKIQIKAPKKEYKNIISLIKTSGIGEKVKFVRVK